MSGLVNFVLQSRGIYQITDWSGNRVIPGEQRVVCAVNPIRIPGSRKLHAFSKNIAKSFLKGSVLTLI